MKKIVYLLALGTFGLITTEFSVIGILPQIAEHFNVSMQMAGWLLSAFAIVVAITAPFSTILTSRVNRKHLLITSLGVFILSNVISAYAPNFIVAMLARILPALFHPIFWAIATGIAAASVEPKEAPRAVSVIYGGLSAAMVIGVPLATALGARFGWQAAYLSNAAINLVSLLGLLLWMQDTPVREEGHHNRPLDLLKNPQQWVNLLITLILVSGLFSAYGYFADYVKVITHATGAQTSMMLFLFGVAGFAGNWVTGKFLTRSILAFVCDSHSGTYSCLYVGKFLPINDYVGSDLGIFPHGKFLNRGHDSNEGRWASHGICNQPFCILRQSGGFHWYYFGRRCYILFWCRKYHVGGNRPIDPRFTWNPGKNARGEESSDDDEFLI